MKIKFLGLLAFLTFLISCNNDDENTPAEPTGDYAKGVIILNEGNFGTSNASVSFLGTNNELENNIYQNTNNELLGNTAQSIGFNDELAFIILNGSNKIKVVNRYTFEVVETISDGLQNPRYITFYNDNAYVSNWGDPGVTTDDYIAVYSNSYTLKTTIPVAEGPEKLIIKDDKLYVAQQGGYGQGNAITIINTTNNTVEKTLTVGDVPNSMAINNNTLFVLCGGNPSYAPQGESIGSLVRVNTNNQTIENTLVFPESQHPSNLVLDNGNLYFTIDNGIYKQSINSSTLSEPIFTTTEQGVYGIYGFNVHNDIIYVADAGDYNSEGNIYTYSNTGSLLQNHTVGIIPNGFYFND